MEEIRAVTWSYSRRNLLEQCPLRYYFTYYGSNKRVARDDPQKTALHFLRKLQNRHERAGSILHLVIATFLRKAQAGEVWSTARLRSWAQYLFSRDIEYSAKNPDRLEVPQERYAPVLLREFHYHTPNAWQMYEEALERLLTAVETFAKNPAYAFLREVATHEKALIEHRIAIQKLPCKVDGRVDLAYQTSQGPVVVDWKLGDGATGDDSLQLVAYALWACEHFRAAPSDIALYKAYIASGALTGSQLTETVVARGQGRIVQDTERMLAMDRYGRAGQAEAFSPCAQAAVCSLCPFQKACPEGRVFLDARD